MGGWMQGWMDGGMDGWWVVVVPMHADAAAAAAADGKMV